MSLVLFFDGSCGFCNRSLRLVHRLDRNGKIDFAPLQGNLAKSMGLEKYAKKKGGAMVVLRERDEGIFDRSDALVELGKSLGQPWKLLACCLAICPKVIRDSMYDLIANNRYRIAGKKDSCWVPDDELKARMRE